MKRTLACIGAGMALWSVGLTSPAQATSITYSFGAPLPIDPNDETGFAGFTTPATPRITLDEAGTIADLNVFVEGYSHESWREVDFVLLLLNEDLSAFERAVVLRGGGALEFEDEPVTDLSLVFDDEADGLVPLTGLTSGAYQTTDRFDYIANGFLDPIPVSRTLAEFAVGLEGDRTFALFARDYFGPDNAGVIGDWGLEVTFADASPVPVPAMAPLFLASCLVLRRLKSARG